MTAANKQLIIYSQKPFQILLLSTGESLCNIVPVHYIINCLHIIWPHIFVLQVVRMLPYINSKQGHKSCEERFIIKAMLNIVYRIIYDEYTIHIETFAILVCQIKQTQSLNRATFRNQMCDQWHRVSQKSLHAWQLLNKNYVPNIQKLNVYLSVKGQLRCENLCW